MIIEHVLQNQINQRCAALMRRRWRTESGRSELAEDANYRDAVKKPPAAVNVGDIIPFHECFIKLGGH